jgi:retron-type reverse transcriptase
MGPGRGHHVAESFDTIDHSILLDALREKVHDQRMIKLIRKMLEAGYLEDWRYHPSLSGTPQGGVLTPPTTLQNPL